MGIAKKIRSVRKLFFHWPLLFVLVVWCVFAGPYIFKHRVPFASTYLVTFFAPWNASYGMPVKNNAMPDVIGQIYPWKQVTINSWKQGQVPLWNPYSFSGTPQAGNYQTAVFTPLNILFFILPFIDAWSVMILLQPLADALGMYWLGRTLGRSTIASAVASLGFMFCNFLVTWMAYGTLGWAIAFLPLALVGIFRQADKPSFGNGVLVTLAVALSFVSGHFQVSLYFLAAVVFFILWQGIRDRAYASMRNLFLFVLLGLGIVLPQLLLTYNSYIQSTRDIFISLREIIPWQYILTFFAPDILGNPVTRNDWFGHYAEWGGFAGTAVLFFAIASFFGKEKKPIIPFVVLFIISILFSYQTPLTQLLFTLKLPVLSTSAASRIIVLSSFSLAVLSSYGIDALRVLWEEKQKKRISIFIACVALCILLSWFFVFVIRPYPAEALAIAKRNLILPSLISAGVVGLTVLGLWQKRFIPVLSIMLLAIVGFDNFRFAQKWMPFDPAQYVYPPVPSISVLKDRIGNDRIFGGIGAEVGSTFGLPLIEGYDAMYLGRYGQFITAASKGVPGNAERSVVQIDKHGLFTDKTFQLLGVRYILHRISDARNVWAFPFWEYPQGVMNSIYKDQYYELFEYTKAFPRAFLVSSYELVTQEKQIIARLFSGNFNLQDSVILESRPRIEPQNGEGTVNIIKYSPNEVILQVETKAPKLLFLSDVFENGWQATVDGKYEPILRADFDFRALAVEPGTHTVRFFYWPGYLTAGFSVSGICLVIVVGGFLAASYNKRRRTV